MTGGLDTFFTVLLARAAREFEMPGRRSLMPGARVEAMRNGRACVDERKRKDQPEEKTRDAHGGERGS
ncbi:hypothetical protein APY03_3125 [Variovorax sp. WDL1]|nr:hypothetical protein APY03_3125 [Variovorax sp. WDL1]